MFRRILLGSSLALSLGSCLVDPDIEERKRFEKERYEIWAEYAESVCINLPPKDPREFEVWLNGKAIAGEGIGDMLRREMNGEPTCMEERHNYVNGVPRPKSWDVQPPLR